MTFENGFKRIYKWRVEEEAWGRVRITSETETRSGGEDIRMNVVVQPLRVSVA